MVDYLDFK